LAISRPSEELKNLQGAEIIYNKAKELLSSSRKVAILKTSALTKLGGN
jgi:hypothetical protein